MSLIPFLGYVSKKKTKERELKTRKLKTRNFFRFRRGIFPGLL